MHVLLLAIAIRLLEAVAVALLACLVCLFLGIRIGGLRPIQSFHGQIYACASILLFGVILGLIFQNMFLSLIFYVAATFALVPSLICLMVFFAKALTQKTATPQLKSAAILWIVCLISVVLVYASGSFALAIRTDATQKYVGRIMPILDEIKSQSGAFPTKLPKQAGSEKTYLAYNVGYWSDGKDFRFSYDDGTGMMDGYELNSTERKWHFVSY